MTTLLRAIKLQGGYTLTQGEIKSRSLAWFTLGPDITAMPFYDAPYRRQPHAGTFKFFDAMQTLKGGEKLVGVSHVEARAIIAHI